MECWPNIQSATLTPRKYGEGTLGDTLSLLCSRSSLRHLTIKAPVLTEEDVTVIARMRNLQSLSIEWPSRAILQVLPEWLDSLQGTLRTLRFTASTMAFSLSVADSPVQESCGSITPGVLRSFLPHMSMMTSFSLGLSSSLTDDDVFPFWEGLPSLRILEFRYYLASAHAHRQTNGRC